jgi:recombination protein RecT
MNRTVAEEKKANDGPTELIRQYRDDFALVLPSHIKPDTWIRLTTGLFRRDQDLADVARKNIGSMLAALLDCARLGLEPGDTYHLVPFGDEIVGIPDYTGLIELIYRAGAVSSVKCAVIYQNDLLPHPDDVAEEFPRGRPRFLWVPSEMDRPHHAPDWFADRGEMIGAYAYAVMLDGSISQVILRNKAEIEKVRDESKGAHKPNSPWRKWPDRMWRKTVIRELEKFVPSSAEFRKDKLRDAVHVEAERIDTRTLTELPAILDRDIIDGAIVDSEQPASDTQPSEITGPQLHTINAMLDKLQFKTAADKATTASLLIGRDIRSTRQMTGDEATTVVDLLERVLESDNPSNAMDAVLAELQAAESPNGGN